MLLGEIFQSMSAWQKLSSIPLKPKFAYRILKYIKLVTAEFEIAEKQRVALIHEITGTQEGQEAKIEPGTPELATYAKRFQEILVTPTDLKPLDMDFEEVVNAADEKDESLSVQDLAMLEVFFNFTDKVGSEAGNADEN